MSSLFYSYSHKDETLRDKLETHLATLKREKVIGTWYDREIRAGQQIDSQIIEHLERADIILLSMLQAESAEIGALQQCPRDGRRIVPARN